MQAILETQENIAKLTASKVTLEAQLADINEDIAADIATVGQLKASLDEAIARGTIKSAEG